MLIEVTRGMIAGLGIEVDRLAKEANAWLNRLSSRQESLSLYPARSARRELNHDRVLAVSLDLDLVASALQHPSWFVAWNAARLFEASGPTVRHRELLREVLYDGRGRALFLVGTLANAVWGGDAFQALYDRLDGNRVAGCAYLYKPLIAAAGSPGELNAAIARVLVSLADDDPKLVEAAAKALSTAEVGALTAHASTINRIFQEWQRRPSWCEKCGNSFEGHSCDSCHIVPGASVVQNPRHWG